MAVSRVNWILGIAILVGMVVVSGIGGFNLLADLDPHSAASSFWLMAAAVILALSVLWHFLDAAGWLDRARGRHVDVTEHRAPRGTGS